MHTRHTILLQLSLNCSWLAFLLVQFLWFWFPSQMVSLQNANHSSNRINFKKYIFSLIARCWICLCCSSLCVVDWCWMLIYTLNGCSIVCFSGINRIIYILKIDLTVRREFGKTTIRNAIARIVSSSSSVCFDCCLKCFRIVSYRLRFTLDHFVYSTENFFKSSFWSYFNLLILFCLIYVKKTAHIFYVYRNSNVSIKYLPFFEIVELFNYRFECI